jgi:DNA-directed RNA polymerase specialized sigma24 family protein
VHDREEAREFRTTHWSVVREARGRGSEASAAALEKLCRTYWPPLYAFVRRKGYNPDEAEDLVQGFFAQFLEKNYLKAVDASLGKFRTFLLCSMKHFLANEWDRAQALKRGGGFEFIALDVHDAEQNYLFEVAESASPETLFERRWVEAILQQVLTRLRDECNESGTGERFEELKIFLIEDKGAVSFAEAGLRLNMTEAAVKGVVRRMRQRYRELFREEIVHTVSDPKEIDEEIRHVLEVLSRG